MDEREKQQKLKDLERTLAEELSDAPETDTTKVAESPGSANAGPSEGTAPKVESSATKPGPASGTASSTPTSESPSASTGAPNASSVAPASAAQGAPDAPLTADDFDELLRASDPEFERQLKDISEGIKSAAPSLSIEAINLDELIEDEEEDLEPVFDRSRKADFKQSRFMEKLSSIYKSLIWLPQYVFKTFKEKGFREGWSQVKSEVPKAKEFVLAELRALREELRILFDNFQRQNRQFRRTLGLLAITLLALGYFLTKLLSDEGLPFPKSKDFLSSFDSVASSITRYSSSEPMEDFNSPLRHPEHVVLLPKLVINLKPSETSGPNPMASFELFVEAHSRDVAVEVKSREKEMMDLTARVTENMKYDDFADPSGDGKERLKKAIRREMNKVLTTGRVKQVYFKVVFHKR